MAVATKYRIPFVSVDGISYRIDILAQYDGSQPASWPIALQPGETPITISEDDSDDIFTPIRPSTGSISICTQLPNGQMLNLDDIQPANNIQSPVLLQRQSGQSWITDWQGFLSCESYNQEYTGQPQNIDLPIISVLEALDAVKFNTAFIGHKQIRSILAEIIRNLEAQSPISNTFDYIYFDTEAWRFLNKYIDSATLIEIKEQSNENRTEYEVMGRSCKAIIEDICKFIGWTAREKGASLYFESPIPKYGMKQCTTADLEKTNAAFQSALVAVALTDKDMTTFSWRGDGHQMSITQGAKSVEVVANMEDYKLDMSSPTEMPSDSIYTSSIPVVVDRENNKTATGYVSRNNTFNSKHDFKVLHLVDDSERGEVEVAGTSQQLYYSTALGSTWSTMPAYYHHYVGALMAQFKNTNDNYEKTGLYVAAVPYDNNVSYITENMYAVKSRSLMPLNVSKGSLKIKVEAYTLFESPTQGNYTLYLDSLTQRNEEVTPIVPGDKIKMAIRWGSKWLTTNKTWSNSYQLFEWEKTEDNEITIPITAYNSGEFFIYIYPLPMVGTTPSAGPNRKIYEYIIQSITIKYEPEDIIGDDRSSNHYFKDLKVNFNDEQSNDLSYASMLNNVASPSHIYDSTTVATKTVEYQISSLSTAQKRPEVALLTKMQSFYSVKRRIMELEIEKQTSMPDYSIMRVIGENNRVFRPVAESVDIQTRKATLKCIEIPSN